MRWEHQSLSLPRNALTVRCWDPSSKLVGMMVLTTTYMIVELVVGNLTNSMALVADSFHMLSDVIALIIAYISVR